MPIDHATGKSKGFAFAEIPDQTKALVAISSSDGQARIGGRAIGLPCSRKTAGCRRQADVQSRGAGPGTYRNPREPVKAAAGRRVELFSPTPLRRGTRTIEQKLPSFTRSALAGALRRRLHRRLEDPHAHCCKSLHQVPKQAEGENRSEEDMPGGYRNRWLRIGNRLAVSPFTVKSSIANGFANLVGGCYRVIDEHKVQSHGDMEKATIRTAVLTSATGSICNGQKQASLRTFPWKIVGLGFSRLSNATMTSLCPRT